ncbi:uncharacterized protein LOC144158699 [Haemaphysalis longicornis]
MIVDVSAVFSCAKEKLDTLNECTRDKGIVRRLLLKNLARKWWHLLGGFHKEEIPERPPQKRQRDSADEKDTEPAKRLKLVCQPVQAPVEQGAAEEPAVEPEVVQPNEDGDYPIGGVPFPAAFDFDDLLEEPVLVPDLSFLDD